MVNFSELNAIEVTATIVWPAIWIVNLGAPTMAGLNDTRIYRGGRTARAYRLETKQASLAAGKGCMRLLFSLSSKGGGTTDVNAEIGKEDFPQLIAIMTEIDRQLTMSAMATEMAKQIEQQPILDAQTAAVGRDSIRRAAQEKYNAAPYGDDDSEQFVLQSVTKLISEIEEKAKGATLKSLNLRVVENS
jgi:hypothetical protein